MADDIRKESDPPSTVYNNSTNQMDIIYEEWRHFQAARPKEEQEFMTGIVRMWTDLL